MERTKKLVQGERHSWIGCVPSPGLLRLVTMTMREGKGKSAEGIVTLIDIKVTDPLRICGRWHLQWTSAGTRMEDVVTEPVTEAIAGN